MINGPQKETRLPLQLQTLVWRSAVLLFAGCSAVHLRKIKRDDARVTSTREHWRLESLIIVRADVLAMAAASASHAMALPWAQCAAHSSRLQSQLPYAMNNGFAMPSLMSGCIADGMSSTPTESRSCASPPAGAPSKPSKPLSSCPTTSSFSFSSTGASESGRVRSPIEGSLSLSLLARCGDSDRSGAAAKTLAAASAAALLPRACDGGVAPTPRCSLATLCGDAACCADRVTTRDGRSRCSADAGCGAALRGDGDGCRRRDDGDGNAAPLAYNQATI